MARREHNTPIQMKRVGSVQRSFAAALVVVMLVPSFGTAWTTRTPSFSSHVDPSLSAGEVALVHTTAGLAGALSLKLAQLGAVDIQTESAADTVIARLSGQALAAIATDPTVTIATHDTAIVATGGDETDLDTQGNPSPADSAGILAINTPLAWRTSTGAGVTVALMDSGIAQHPDLARGKVDMRVDFVNDGSALLDPAGHGTHIAGLIAANGDAFKGVAPDAKLVSLRVLDQYGTGRLSNVIKAFDWLLRFRNVHNIKVLNLSWGAPQATTYHKDLIAALAESAWFAGITVVVAAGNSGAAAGAVTTPGADPFVVTAGSMDDQGTVAAADDVVSSFSSRGPTLDGFVKPDVLAPGRHVVSLRAAGAVNGSAKPQNLRNDNGQKGNADALYIRMSGTSASAGLVSGVAALVASANPRYGPTQIKGAIVASGRAVGGSVTPAVDAAKALTAMTTVNVGLRPSKLLVDFLVASGVKMKGVTWEGVTWESVTWESVTWERINWQSVSWESVSWESVSWETVSWEGVTWEAVITP